MAFQKVLVPPIVRQKMKATGSFETSGSARQPTRHTSVGRSLKLAAFRTLYCSIPSERSVCRTAVFPLRFEPASSCELMDAVN